jgi:hypothetical protein
MSDAADEFREVFDWIEVRLEEINDDIEMKSAQLENKVGYKAQNKVVDAMIADNKKLYSNLTAGAAKYYSYADKLLTASVDYAMPIYAGNLYIPSLLFVKRFQLNPFFDFANATYAYNSTAKGLSFQHYSFGATLKVDCHILGFGAPISVGVRYARNYTEDLFVADFKKNSVNLVLSVDL